MSYILDALRKSDQQRQHGAAPTLMSVPLPTPGQAHPRRLGLGLMALLLLVIGIVIGWLQPWQAGPQQLPAATLDAAPAQAQQNVPRLPSESATVEPRPLPDRDKRAPAALAPAPTPAPTPVTAAQPARAAAPAGAPAPPAEAPKPAPKAVVADAAVEQKVLSRAELPPDLQQEIPKMQVSLHAYSSKPRSRLVSINDQLLQEGDALISGLILEQVTSDGMIFSYKGYRFRQSVH